MVGVHHLGPGLIHNGKEREGPRGKDGKGPLKKHATTNLANNRWTYVVHGGDNPFTKQNGDLI